jgi:hypothetical protein
MGCGRSAGCEILGMILLQLTALCIVLIYVLYHAAGRAEGVGFLSKASIVSMACWLTEETSIRFYGFYSYNPSWSLFLGHVPLLIILIWPVLIHSSWDLASQLSSQWPKLKHLAAGTLVCTDALLIEPIAVNADLWAWNEPGIFHVPPIGILGWGILAFFCTLFFENRTPPSTPTRRIGWTLLVPVIGTHALLLAIWWGALRWINMDVPSVPMAVVAWVVSMVLTLTILQQGTGRHIKKRTLLLRVPASLFFLVLLLSNVGGAEILVIYVLASVPPYITIMVQQYRP